ncbi:hypothetical protein [Streptomyces silvensis]|uniref:Uncharacterized protein n=1 Tax=Streptomyces silvensis TaxID=1765722 RepID=A0A0W7X1Z7_9ACTN|nr:hypothetical protein [Streptomyces silvensis]KUF16851.1 hypothetical protein AT728_23370 [Streptomyces silvensis]
MPDPTPDLASFAAALADELPGTWLSEHAQHPQHTGQSARAADLWDMNLLAHALAEHPLDQDAILTREDGMHLYVITRPRRSEEFLIGALAPADIPPEAFRGVREPDGIAVQDDPFQAAKEVVVDLLPRYDKALAQVQHNAARIAAAQPPDLVVFTLSGRDFHVTKPERAHAARILIDNGCTYDQTRNVFVLPGKDTARQAQAIQNAAAQLDRLGIGVSIRPAPARPALDTTPSPPQVPSKDAAGTARAR